MHMTATVCQHRRKSLDTLAHYISDYYYYYYYYYKNLPTFVTLIPHLLKPSYHQVLIHSPAVVHTELFAIRTVLLICSNSK